jgi:hypothetical protein
METSVLIQFVPDLHLIKREGSELGQIQGTIFNIRIRESIGKNNKDLAEVIKNRRVKDIHETIMHSSISPTSLARLMPEDYTADVEAGTSLVECLREIEERRSKHGVS